MISYEINGHKRLKLNIEKDLMSPNQNFWFYDIHRINWIINLQVTHIPLQIHPSNTQPSSTHKPPPNKTRHTRSKLHSSTAISTQTTHTHHSKLHHCNLVKLYGVCTKNKPIKIITEYLKNGTIITLLAFFH